MLPNCCDDFCFFKKIIYNQTVFTF
jgi:hypothetical protein